MTDAAQAKFNMIEQQIRPWEVLDNRVLDVFDKIDRADFVPEKFKGLAYIDCQLPILEDESMLPPTLEGRMLQALLLQPTDSVLEIGSCCGYITACLASLSDHVDSVDFHPEATAMASENLQQQGVDNVDLKTIESLDDITQTQRYDAIAVCAGSLDDVPQNLKQALAIGGRLFAVTGQSPVKEAQRITRVGQDEWQTESLFETDIPAIG